MQALGAGATVGALPRRREPVRFGDPEFEWRTPLSVAGTPLSGAGTPLSWPGTPVSTGATPVSPVICMPPSAFCIEPSFSVVVASLLPPPPG